LNYKVFNLHRTSRIMVPAMGIILGMTALAQDSLQLRTPRKTFGGRIDIRTADIADVGAVECSVPGRRHRSRAEHGRIAERHGGLPVGQRWGTPASSA